MQAYNQDVIRLELGKLESIHNELRFCIEATETFRGMHKFVNINKKKYRQ